jgi:hypothetical protein
MVAVPAGRFNDGAQRYNLDFWRNLQAEGPNGHHRKAAAGLLTGRPAAR